jgi:competence ComEA-like helix-hairpin-helix protein
MEKYAARIGWCSVAARHVEVPARLRGAVPSQAPRTRRQGASARLRRDFRNVRSILLAVALVFLLSSVSALAQKIPPAQPINLNSATIAELETLPGIGANTAKSIVDFRKHSGPFQRVEDLLAIKGISKTKLEKLRPYVTVASTPPSAPKQQPSSSH